MKSNPAPKRRAPAPPRRVAVATADLPQPGYPPYIEWLYAAGILLVGLAIYWRSLAGPFLFDDADLFEVTSSVRLKNWYVILTGPRPLLIFSYVLNHWWAGGFDAFQFHIVSVVLHIINALVLWRILRGCLGRDPKAAMIAAFVPFLFLTSPIQTESVAYISSRSEVLAATFYLLALWVFLSPWRDQRPWLASVLIVGLYGCALASKQTAITLPASLLLADYFLLAKTDWRQLKKNWRIYAVLGFVMVAGGFFVIRNIIHVPSAGFFLKDVTWKTYLFTQFRMYFLYLRLLLVPFGLNADYDIAASRSLFDHWAWLALAGLGVLAGAALYFRRRLPLAGFGVLFFFVTLAPTSTFYPLLDYAAERRLYLPAIGFFLAALAVVMELVRAREKTLRTALCSVVVIYSIGTIARNGAWQSSLALWQDIAAKSPHKWRAHNNLGFEYQSRRAYGQAAEEFQKAAELAPPHSGEQAEILSSLGSTFNNRSMYAEAVPYFQAALKISPGNYLTWTNLAIAELRLGRAEGWHDFQKAIDANALAWEPHFARGNMYLEMGRFDEAIKDYERVLTLVPDHKDARQNLQAALAMKRRQ